MKRLTKLLALIMCMAFVIMAITPNTAYAATSVGQVTIKSVKADKKSCLPLVTWSKTKGASGYAVYRKDPFSGWIKVGTTKGTSFKDSTPVEYLLNTELDCGDKLSLQYRVKAYVKSGKKTIYGKASKTKTLKADRYMYDNKLTCSREYDDNTYVLAKADLPEGFVGVKGSLYADDELVTSLYAATEDIFKEREESDEGKVYLAEYDKYSAEADELFDKMCNSESDEEYDKYNLEYTAACKAYSDAYDKFAAPFTELEDLVGKTSDRFYNNLKDSNGNTITSIEDITSIIKAKSTGSYTGWLMKFYISDQEPDSVEATTPDGYKVHYSSSDVGYEISVFVPIASINTKDMYKEKGTKVNFDGHYFQYVFRCFEDGHRVKQEDINLKEIDNFIKNTKITPVAAVRTPDWD